ncbi:MAG TPA: hypothetical protein VK400_14490 [Pyrinomonadaceae bacterium]|nr:hypothetical protein [Pyrinomonadaceae bacterium]
MREYQRTTRECSFDDFQPEIRSAIEKYAEKHDLGNVRAEALMCAETVSEKIKRGFFSKIFGGANYAQKISMLVTPERLLWCALDTGNNAVVLSARLSEVEISDFESNLVEDSGLDVFGFINQSPERVQAFIGLGAEPAAQKFRETVKETVAGAKSK